MTAIVAKSQPTPDDMRRWLTRSTAFWLGALTQVDEKRTRLADYQAAHLRDRSKFRARIKARGVGFSFICAGEALARAHIRNDYTAIFVSINLEEAVEKIRYANMLYDSMPARFQKRKVVDNKTSIEFVDSTGRHRSRLISHPCKDPRGKHKADVYLDEFAHYGHKQRAIYVASVPIVSRGPGQLTIGSTPLAVGDLFHEIMSDERRKYRMFSRQRIPWWECPDLCSDVARARAEAPGMDTASRVDAFARPALVDISNSLDVAEFQQEYELAFLDESQTYFPYDLIFACVSDELSPCESVDQLLKTTQGDLYAGFDVGRTRNTSELVVLERRPKRLVYCYGRSFDRSKFNEQEAFLRKLLNRSNRLKRLCVDQHGLGMNMAENLSGEFRSRVEGIALIGQTKESLAVDLHIVLENEEITLPRDRELVSQIHSIKKTATDAGYSRYDTEKNEQHHCYDTGTETLTEDGWKPFALLTKADKVATLVDGYLRYEHPTEVQRFHYSGDMVRVKNKQIDLLVTPNHHLYIRDVDDEEFRLYPAEWATQFKRRHFEYKKDALWEGDDPAFVVMDGHRIRTEDWVEFLGYWLSEGTLGKRHNLVGVTQKDILNCREMASCLLRLPFRFSLERGGHLGRADRFSFSSPDVRRYLSRLGKQPARYIPKEIKRLSTRLLKILFDAMMLGDGRLGNSWTYYSTSKRLIDDLQEVCLKIGCAGTPSLITPGKGSHNKLPLWALNINRTRLTPVANHRAKQHNLVPYEGEVYCCTVPSHVIYVRRNGSACWCGNSDKMWSLALAVHAAGAVRKRGHRRPVVRASIV